MVPTTSTSPTVCMPATRPAQVRALTRLFFACPTGAEATGPCFTPDGRALFLSVQHPGENSENLANLTTHWPTMSPNLPPMPAVVVFGKEGGGEIGA